MLLSLIFEILSLDFISCFFMIYSIKTAKKVSFSDMISNIAKLLEELTKMNIDAIDLKIINCLQRDARLSNQELADLVNLSPSACHRRVKIMESHGIIEKYQAKINYEKLGIKIEAIVEIKLVQLTETDHKFFLEQIDQCEEVINAYVITGDSNYVLHVAARDLNEFSQFIINKLNKIKGIMSINSKIILDKVIQKSLL